MYHQFGRVLDVAAELLVSTCTKFQVKHNLYFQKVLTNSFFFRNKRKWNISRHFSEDDNIVLFFFILDVESFQRSVWEKPLCSPSDSISVKENVDKPNLR